MSGDVDEARAFLREHAHYREDLALWRAVAQRLGGPVVDLGCAAGRVALALAEDGHEVWALDADPHMLSALAEEAAQRGPDVATRIQTHMADMRDFRLESPVPLVIAAMNTLQVMHDPDDHVACLTAVRSHLRDDGEFWFDVAMPDVADIVDSLGMMRMGGAFEDGAGGRTLHSSWYEEFDAVTQTVTYTLRVDHFDAAGTATTRLRRHTVHLFSPCEVQHLLARAGLRVLQAWGGFAGEPLEEPCTSQVYRCGVDA